MTRWSTMFSLLLHLQKENMQITRRKQFPFPKLIISCIQCSFNAGSEKRSFIWYSCWRSENESYRRGKPVTIKICLSDLVWRLLPLGNRPSNSSASLSGYSRFASVYRSDRTVSAVDVDSFNVLLIQQHYHCLLPEKLRVCQILTNFFNNYYYSAATRNICL